MAFSPKITRLTCTQRSDLKGTYKIYSIFFRVAKAPEIFKGMQPTFFMIYFMNAVATLKKIGQILQGTLQITSQGAD